MCGARSGVRRRSLGGVHRAAEGRGDTGHPLRHPLEPLRRHLRGCSVERARRARRAQADRALRDRPRRAGLHGQLAALCPRGSARRARPRMQTASRSRPSTVGRSASSCRASTSGRARSGCEGSSCCPPTSRASGSVTATTTTRIPGRKSATAFERPPGSRSTRKGRLSAALVIWRWEVGKSGIGQPRPCPCPVRVNLLRHDEGAG